MKSPDASQAARLDAPLRKLGNRNSLNKNIYTVLNRTPILEVYFTGRIGRADGAISPAL